MTVVDRDTAFGPLVAASDVEECVLALVQKWLPDYLAEVDRVQGQAVGTMPQPRGWVISSEIEKMPEDQTPTVIIASPGLTEPPLADGSGVYTARWRVLVGVHLSARGNALALRLARLYTLALRALLVQQQRDPDTTVIVRRIDWVDERYDTLPSIDDRTICTGTVEVGIEVMDVTTRHAGPLEPVLPPGALGPDSPTWPVATSADAPVIKDPIE